MSRGFNRVAVDGWHDRSDHRRPQAGGPAHPHPRERLAMPRPEELRREAVRRAEDRTREETRDLAVRLLQLQLARLQASLRGEGPGPGEAVDAYRQMHLDLAELDAPTGQAFGELVTYWRSLASLG